MKVIVLSVLLLCVLVMPSGAVLAADLMVASFENNGRSDIGTDIGTWDYNPADPNQSCSIEVVTSKDVLGKVGVETHVLKISYSVASSMPAFNGIYIKLNNADLSSYDEMSMLIKGDSERGFTTQFKIEMKNDKGERVVYLVKDITLGWQKIIIPMQELKALGSISDWSKMKELVFTFDDITADVRQGAIYVDDIMFSKKEQSQ